MDRWNLVSCGGSTILTVTHLCLVYLYSAILGTLSRLLQDTKGYLTGLDCKAQPLAYHEGFCLLRTELLYLNFPQLPRVSIVNYPC